MSKKKKPGERTDNRFVKTKVIDGKKHFFYGETPKQAEEKRDEYIKSINDRPDNYRDITLAEWMDEWLDIRKTKKIEPQSLKRHEQNIRLHIAPGIGSIKLTELTSLQVDAFMRDRANAPVCYYKKPTQEQLDASPRLSPRSLCYIYNTLNAALEKARLFKLIKENPCEPVEKPEVKRKLPQPLSKDEASKYLTQIAQHPLLYPISILALDTGCRSGELLALKWSNVFFDSGAIHILEGKTQAATRKIRIPARSKDILKAHQKAQLKHIKQYGIRYKDNGLVFANEHGEPIPNYTISKMFKRAAINAGLRDDVKFHNLRDTHATELLELGEHPYNVMARLGHTTLQMTKDYSKVTEQHHESMINKLDEKRSSQKVVKQQRIIKKISLRERPRG